MGTGETTLNSLISAANNTTGKQDSKLTAAVNSLIAGYEGGGGGGGETLHTAIFYTENLSVIEMVSAADTVEVYDPCGTAGKPSRLYSWKDADGVAHTFPFCLTKDVKLYRSAAEKVYIIDPAGTSINSIVVNIDGSPATNATDTSSIVASRKGSTRTVSSYSVSSSFSFNTTANQGKMFGITGGTNKAIVYGPINCSDYSYVVVKHLRHNGGSWSAGGLYIAKSLTAASNGYAPSEHVGCASIGGSTYTDSYWQSTTGDSSWSVSKAIADLDNPAWIETSYDVSGLSQVYLWFWGCDALGAIGSVHLQ